MAFTNVTIPAINATVSVLNATMNSTNSTITAFNSTITNEYNKTASIFLQVLPKETGWLIAAGVAVFILAVFFLIWFLARQN